MEGMSRWPEGQWCRNRDGRDAFSCLPPLPADSSNPPAPRSQETSYGDREPFICPCFFLSLAQRRNTGKPNAIEPRPLVELF